MVSALIYEETMCLCTVKTVYHRRERVRRIKFQNGRGPLLTGEQDSAELTTSPDLRYLSRGVSILIIVKNDWRDRKLHFTHADVDIAFSIDTLRYYYAGGETVI